MSIGKEAILVVWFQQQVIFKERKFKSLLQILFKAVVSKLGEGGQGPQGATELLQGVHKSIYALSTVDLFVLMYFLNQPILVLQLL